MCIVLELLIAQEKVGFDVQAQKGQKNLKFLISQEFYFFSVSFEVCIISYKERGD